MNKILSLSAIILIACCSLSAQEGKGKYALDFTVNPAALFDANAGAMFQMPDLKGRYFIASDIAVRLGLGLGFSNDKDYTDTAGDVYDKYTSLYIRLSPGIEKQFGTDKFKGYIGADLPITSYTDKSQNNFGGVDTKIKNPYGEGYLGIGLNAVFGFDYYLFGNVYIGAEFAPGLIFRKYSDIVENDVVTNKGGTGFDFDLGSSSGIRLGIRF